jgi:adenosylcobinamide-GDP ribazoletransferase
LIKKVLLAFQFCTIVPVNVSGDVTEKDVAASAAFFPLVGAFQGLLTAVVACLLMKVLPPDVVAALALVCLILTNGGFDLDGLADTFDALAVKSSGDIERDRAKRLSVMRDSATGAIGVIALIMTLLLKFVLMRGLLSSFSVLTAGTLFFLMATFSKWINVPVMYHGVSARKDGLGKIFIEHTGLGSIALSTGIIALLTFLVAVLNLLGGSPMNGVGLCVCFCMSAYLLGLLAVKFLAKRFGGLTGDHFGALTEACELLFLLVAYIWLQRSTL